MNKLSICLCGLSLAGSMALADTTMNPAYKWAWSSGAGWINGNVDSTSGIAVYQNVCSGYLYSASAGWICLGQGNPTNGCHYTNSNSVDYGVNVDAAGNLSGYAWSGSFGWINFGWTNVGASNAPKIDLKPGIFSGYAWGGSLGWIGLSNTMVWLKTDFMTNAPGSDSRGDGIPDSWVIEKCGSTNGFKGGTNDSDRDGVSDYDEYVAGLNPMNSNNFFEVVGVSALNGTNLQIQWVSSQSRLYSVERRYGLTDTNGWQPLTSYTSMVGESDSTMLKSLPIDSATQTFYRIRAALPPLYQ
jgi:hypothetical protein